ncbi:unnamed protein product [Brassicogethes aeneus]|uniref:Enhancer of yellow 2 transcription factor n=1 Tax=Brassicogethes aeneus TaxID=1431903 RepID=A0A9P0BBG5_BRAAE|nr:unnamed protein product [Brassicogethes aeneus]
MPQDYDSKISLHLDINHGLDRVTELVQTRLVECGWRDQVRLACRKAIVENGNDQHVPTVDELISTVTPKARALVPDAVKKELLHELELILVNVDKSGYSKSF